MYWRTCYEQGLDTWKSKQRHAWSKPAWSRVSWKPDIINQSNQSHQWMCNTESIDSGVKWCSLRESNQGTWPRLRSQEWEAEGEISRQRLGCRRAWETEEQRQVGGRGAESWAGLDQAGPLGPSSGFDLYPKCNRCVQNILRSGSYLIRKAFWKDTPAAV